MIPRNAFKCEFSINVNSLTHHCTVQIPKHILTLFHVLGKMDYLVGETIDYKCAEGFKLQGTSNRTCESGGTWSGQPPTCIYVQCGQLSLEG